MMKSFKDITALVTGASSGIGKSIARQLAQAGAHLILTARDHNKLEQEATDLRLRYGVRVFVVPGDLGAPGTCEKILEFTQQQNLTVDLLVNNAGSGHNGLFVEESVQDIRAMLELNVRALTHLTRLFLPGMLGRNTGGVLNVASIAGFQPIPYLAVYAATKAFVLSFSEALWGECRKTGVRIFCVCPGNTLTRFHQSAGIEKKKMLFSAPAHEVARFALEKFLKTNQPSGIFGFWNKLMIYAERLGPRRLIIFVTRWIYQSGATPFSRKPHTKHSVA